MRLLLPATLTTREARDTQRMLAQALRREAQDEGRIAAHAAVTVDASALLRFDSAALAVLLECQRLAQAWGKRCVVSQAPAKLMELARLYGLDGVLVFGHHEGAVAG